jgi:precorrin-2 dehydrogenase/sirohydrochlorin ferrochelatase
VYSALLNLEGKMVTVVGGGEVAFRKVSSFIEEDCEIHVIAPSFIEEFKTLGHKVHRIYKCYEEGDCAGSFIVVAATDDYEVNKQIGQFCKRGHILCNVVDNKPLSSFIVPSTLKRGDLTISISTGGASPSLAAKIRRELEDKYDAHYGEYIARLGRIRNCVLEKVTDEVEKKRILKHIITLEPQELEAYEKSHFND